MTQDELRVLVAALDYCKMDEEAVRREANRLPGAGERRYEAERLRQELKRVVFEAQLAFISPKGYEGQAYPFGDEHTEGQMNGA